mmetsp:Transcript_5501/g.9337  ORF Transcript_5501/g.9337 Transcript_5501/m.9337 type:complete len:85 (-) Transcript_5501:178-432(-)
MLIRPNYFENNKFALSTKKLCESSLNVRTKNQGGEQGESKIRGLSFNPGDLQSKLLEVNDGDEEAERKKREFEKKRKNHYKNEF